MAKYKISRKADHDIETMYERGILEFGLRQARKYLSGLITQFETLAANPYIYRNRQEHFPPVRVCPYQSHVIIYRVLEENMIEIIRVRHGREDWL